MSFNPGPIKQAVKHIFSRKRTTANNLPLYFNGIQVARVDGHKHLGIILDSKLSFSQHIQSIIAKARQCVGLLRFMSRYLPRKILDEMYRLYDRSHLDYWDIIYHIPYKNYNPTNILALNYHIDK